MVVAVTGSTGGLGRSVADAFAARGAQVVVHEGDAAERATVEGLVDSAVQRFQQLDALVLDAGVAQADRPLVELGDDAWDACLDRTLKHVFWGIRAALAHMIPRRAGRIIVISGVEGKLPRPGASAYVAAQHGVTGLVKSVAHEVGPMGITVNAILPGSLDNGAGSKLGRPVTIAEVASAAVMLASPAMTSVTGCLFPVDGGTMPY